MFRFQGSQLGSQLAEAQYVFGAMTTYSSSILDVLDEDALVEVLCAAKAARVLGLLASSSKQLCRTARTRVPVRIEVWSQEAAALLVRSSAHSVPPFSACTHLSVSGCLSQDRSIIIPVLRAAAHLTALQDLRLYVLPPTAASAPPTQACEARTARMLSFLPATPHLQTISLRVPAFGVCCARHVGRLVPLTKLCLTDTQYTHVVGDVEAEAAAGDLETAAAADLTSLACLTNLRELHLYGPPAVLPAGAEGPYALPSSLAHLVLQSTGASGMSAAWATHMLGCPTLQHLDVTYGEEEHASMHPAALLSMLRQRGSQLRSLDVQFHWRTKPPYWDVPVEGLPPPEPIEDPWWHPDASLAAQTGLESLEAGDALSVETAAEWQHMAQLSALTHLTGARIPNLPPQLEGASLAVLFFRCRLGLSGHGVGQLLLACPRLQTAVLTITCDAPPAMSPPGTTALSPHSSLGKLLLFGSWGHASAAHFAQLAPVLRGVASLGFHNWPPPSSSEPGPASVQLPTLSPCTAVTSLTFYLDSRAGLSWEQEDILSMVAPLSQLVHLSLCRVRGVNARMVVPLQHMLPHLQLVELSGCGMLLPTPPDGQQQQQQQQQQVVEEEEDDDEDAGDRLAEPMLAKVLQLVRPDLVLQVNGYSRRGCQRMAGI
jgi:hypothetical protein